MNRPDARNPLREFTDARIAPAQRRQSADPRSPQLWSGPCQSAGCHSSAVRQPTPPLAALGLEALTVHSAAPDRHTYLRRPDPGGSSPMSVAPTSPPAASAPPTCCW